VVGVIRQATRHDALCAPNISTDAVCTLPDHQCHDKMLCKHVTSSEDPALHKKSGQKSDAVVNKDFLVSFGQPFEIKKVHFAYKKRSLTILCVQSQRTPCSYDPMP